jgi:hypothetical protein
MAKSLGILRTWTIVNFEELVGRSSLLRDPLNVFLDAEGLITANIITSRMQFTKLE